MEQLHLIHFSLAFPSFWSFLCCALQSHICICAMSQSLVLGPVSVSKGVQPAVVKRKVKIPYFDNTTLIEGYSKTIVGRCMNPRSQDMKTLLFLFLRIWHLEGKVVGADLGMGKFQFDFDDEADIVEVLKMAPFHLDNWMVSMVRWSPTVDPLYPSSIIFWVRVIRVPFQFWAEPTFMSIGEDIGRVQEVDIDGGRIQVVVNGLKPLCFETEVEFYNGEETIVSLRYERLYGYCSHCFSLCHDKVHCPQLKGVEEAAAALPQPEVIDVRRTQSYKGAVKAERKQGSYQDGSSRDGYRGRSNGEGSQAEGKHSFEGKFGRGSKSHPDSAAGEPMAKQRRFHSYVQYNEHRFRQGAAKESVPLQTTVVDTHDDPSCMSGPVKVFRKSLFQDEVLESSVAAAMEESEPVADVPMGAALVDSDKVEGLVVDSEDIPRDSVVSEHIEGMVSTSADEASMVDVSGSIGASIIQGVAGLVMEGGAAIATTRDVGGGDSGVTGSAVSGEELTMVESRDEVAVETVSGDPPSTAPPLVISGVVPDAASGAQDKAHKGKGPMGLRGLGSKKLNVYLRTTPRKRPAPKGATQAGEMNNPKPKEEDKGATGCLKPPIPKADK